MKPNSLFFHLYNESDQSFTLNNNTFIFNPCDRHTTVEIAPPTCQRVTEITAESSARNDESAPSASQEVTKITAELNCDSESTPLTRQVLTKIPDELYTKSAPSTGQIVTKKSELNCSSYNTKSAPSAR